MPDSEFKKSTDITISTGLEAVHPRFLTSKGSGLFYWRSTRFFAVIRTCCILLLLLLLILPLLTNLPANVTFVIFLFLLVLLFPILSAARELFRRDGIDCNRKLVSVRGKAIPFRDLAGIQILRAEVPFRTRYGRRTRVYYELNFLLCDGSRVFLCNGSPARWKDLENEAVILRDLLGIPCSFSFYTQYDETK